MMAELAIVPKKGGNQEPGGVALLSCELCTRRKIRCDKRQPCSACLKTGKECVSVVRARLPRGRRGGRKEANNELRSRVRRLEDLVLSLSSNSAGGNHVQPTPTSPPISDSGGTSKSVQDASESNSRENSMSTAPVVCPKKNNDISRLLGSSVWTQLSNEVRSTMLLERFYMVTSRSVRRSN